MATWKKSDDTLKQQGVKKSERPPQPEPKAAYPSKRDMLLEWLREFRGCQPDFQVQAILADALYGNATWTNQRRACSPKRRRSVH